MGPTGALLDHSWVTLGALIGALERPWGAFKALLERSWDDHDRSWDRLDDFGPPMDRFWALQQSVLSIRSSILGSQRIDFAVSVFASVLSLELLHETRNVKPTFVDVPCSAAVRAQHMESDFFVDCRWMCFFQVSASILETLGPPTWNQIG